MVRVNIRVNEGEGHREYPPLSVGVGGHRMPFSPEELHFKPISTIIHAGEYTGESPGISLHLHSLFHHAGGGVFLLA